MILLMNSLVPQKKFFMTKTAIGSGRSAKINSYTKPNSKRPPLDTCKDLIWLQTRELSSYKTMQGINMWEYLVKSYVMYCFEFRQRQKHKRIAMFLRKKRNAINCVYVIRRDIISHQRKRMWDQLLDTLVALSNYANGKPINNLLIRQKLSGGKNINTSNIEIASITNPALPSQNVIMQRIEAMLPLLPQKLLSMNMPRKIQTLFEFVNFIVSKEKKDEIEQNYQSDEIISASHHHKNNMKHIERTLGCVSVQNTPYIQRKITEYQQQIGSYSPRPSRPSTVSISTRPKLPNGKRPSTSANSRNALRRKKVIKTRGPDRF